MSVVATPMRAGGGPLYPVNCPVCDARLGSLYREGLSLKPYVKRCTACCVKLWPHGYGRAGWRDLPPDLRQVQLAAFALDDALSQQGRAS